MSCIICLFEVRDLILMPPHFKIIISFSQIPVDTDGVEKSPRWKRHRAFQVDLLSAPGRPVGVGVCSPIATGTLCLIQRSAILPRPPIGPGQSFNRQSQTAFVPLSLTAVHPPEKVIGPSDRSRKERSGEGTLTGLGDDKKYYISGQILWPMWPVSCSQIKRQRQLTCYSLFTWENKHLF